MVLSLIIQNIGFRLYSIDNQVQLLEFDCLLMLFIRRLKNETNDFVCFKSILFICIIGRLHHQLLIL
jgi:hypothetical protein